MQNSESNVHPCRFENKNGQPLTVRWTFNSLLTRCLYQLMKIKVIKKCFLIEKYFLEDVIKRRSQDVHYNRKPNTLCTQWNEIQREILTIKCSWPRKPSSFGNLSIILWLWKHRLRRKLHFLPDGSGKITHFATGGSIHARNHNAKRHTKNPLDQWSYQKHIQM